MNYKMGNLVTNILNIKGKREEILIFLNNDLSAIFDANKLIPIPEGFKKDFDWYYDNWMCRNPFTNLELLDFKKRNLKFRFNSENGVPFPLLHKISIRFPKLKFFLAFYEILDDMMGELILQNNEILSLKQGIFADFRVKNPYMNA